MATGTAAETETGTATAAATERQRQRKVERQRGRQRQQREGQWRRRNAVNQSERCRSVEEDQVSAKTKRLADELGVSASELGALNAAHANANAFKNAAPNSRVGRIGAYRTAVLEGRELEAELAEKQALLDALTPADRPASEVAAELDDAVEDVAAKARDVAQLEDDLAAAGGADPRSKPSLLRPAMPWPRPKRRKMNCAKSLTMLPSTPLSTPKCRHWKKRWKSSPSVNVTFSKLRQQAGDRAVEAAVKKLLGL